MLALRPYWRPHVSTRPREVLYDETRGEIVSTTRSKAEVSKDCQGWYAKAGGQPIALYTLDGGSFVLQIGTVRFSVDDSLEATMQQKRWSREISFRQGSKTVTVVDRSRGYVPQQLSISRLIAALSLDDLDLDDLLGDVCNWTSNRQAIPRDVFAMRLAEEKAPKPA